MSEYDVLINKYDALNNNYDQLYPKPMKHANTHASGGTDPITPGDIGAYSKNEIDAFLTGKMSNALGQAGANLLEWASAQTVGGAFYINPTVTTVGVPSVARYAGLLEINDSGKRMIISTSGGGAPITYVNVTSAGVWQDWNRLATATDLATKVSKSGDTMTGQLKISGDAIANSGVNAWLAIFGGANVDNGASISLGNGADGAFKIRAKNNTNPHVIFEGKPDGSLIWGDKNVLHTGNAQALGFPKVETGTRVGTGTSPYTITTSINAKLVFIYRSDTDGTTNATETFIALPNSGWYKSYTNSVMAMATISGKTVTIIPYNNNIQGDYCCNYKGATYAWIAIG